MRHIRVAVVQSSNYADLFLPVFSVGTTWKFAITAVFSRTSPGGGLRMEDRRNMELTNKRIVVLAEELY